MRKNRIAGSLATPAIFIGSPASATLPTTTVSIDVIAPINYTQMYLTNTPGCATGGVWEAYSNPKAWTATIDGSGDATVFAKFKTAGDVESACVSDKVGIMAAASIACTDTSSDLAYGSLRDSGDTAGEYSDDEDCDFVINHTGPLVIRFNSFLTEEGYDYLTFYQDTKMPANEIDTFDGATVPGDIIVANGPVVVNFMSDGSVTDEGFDISWGTGSGAVSNVLAVNGGATYTDNPLVTLSINLMSPILKEMYITDVVGCGLGGVWETKSNSKSWMVDFTSTGLKTIYIKFRDQDFHETTCDSIAVFYYQGTPVVNFAGDPLADDSYLYMEPSGSYLKYYKYKVGPALTTDCTSITGYSVATSISTWVDSDISTYPDGPMKLCGLGGFELDLFQSVASPTEYLWTKLTPAAYEFQSSSLTFLETDNELQFTIKASKTVNHPVTLYYNFFGELVVPLGLVSGQVVLPANASTVNIIVPMINTIASDVDKSITVGISRIVTASRGVVGPQGFSTAIVQDAQRATTDTVLDISRDGLCAVVNPGILKCSGSIGGSNGGTYVYSDQYTAVSGLTNFTSIPIKKSSHTCALNSTNQLYCWGWGFDGNLGLGNSNDYSTPQLVPGLTWKQVVGDSWNVICGIDSLDDLYCWGDQTYSNGAVGNGTTSDSKSPTLIDSTRKYSFVQNTGYRGCAISTGGELRCWGGQPIGDGTENNSNSPVHIDPSTTYKYINLKNINGACALTTAGAIKCWGQRFWIENDWTAATAPELVDASRVYDKIYNIYSTGCALSSQEVYCFGNVNNVHEATPIPVDAGMKYQSLLAISDKGFCGILLDGTLKCWGNNWISQNQVAGYVKPTLPTVFDTDKYLSHNGNCGITVAGRAKCLDNNYLRHISTPKNFQPTTFQEFGSTINWKQISGKCALSISDKLYCWGGYDQPMGISYNYNSQNPIEQAPSYSFKTISHVGSVVCGILNDDSLVCMGSSGNGVFGTGSAQWETYNTPKVVDSGVTYRSVALSNSSVCGVTMDNKLKCWGDNEYGKLGTGDLLERLVPTWVDTATTYKDVKASSSSYSQNCGLTVAGEIKCWGRVLTGVNTWTTTTTPTLISGADVFLSIDVGSVTGCGVRDDNRVLCWGDNYGGIGDGTQVDRPIPTLTTDTTTYNFVATTDSESCGITVAGPVKCWGRDISSSLQPALVTTPGTISALFKNHNTTAWVGLLAPDGGLVYKSYISSVPGVSTGSLYFEHIQGLVDR